MTPEERLRQLLQESDDVPVAGDGLTRIRQRLDARRSLRTRLLVPAVSLAGVVAVAAVGALGVAATDDGSIRPDVATRDETREPVEPSPTGTACSGGLCPEPKPAPSLPTTGVTTSGNGVPVWPFTTDAQAADWQADRGARGWAADPVQVVQHLLDDYLELPGTTAVGTAGGGDVARVVVKVGGRPVSTVRVEQVGRTTTGPWSVTGATSEDVGVTSPEPGDAIESPLTVAGHVTGVDESVHVQLLTSVGSELAGGFAPAGAERPWSLPVRWASPAWSVGAVVASTSDGNGVLRAIALTPVRRGGSQPGAPAPGSTLVAIEDGRVVLADALTGARLRQLSYPPPDFVDSDPDGGGDDGVVWVRTKGDGCTSSIIRAGFASGPAGITVDSEPRARRLPSLSDGGRSLAWVERACDEGSPDSVLVRGPDARLTTVVEAPEPVTAIDVHDDGTLLLGLANAVFVLPEGTSTLTGARRLVPRPGCTVRAPAWDGDVPTAWERCDDGQRLTRYDAKGAAASASAPVGTASEVLRSKVVGGYVLVVLADGLPFRFSEGRLHPIPRGKELAQAAW